MQYKVYEKVFDEEFIDELLKNTNRNNFNQGHVGTRVNLKQKRRKDLFYTDTETLIKIDNKYYESMYEDVKTNFSDIKYREKWKLGFYNHEDQGFYNLHTDTAGETRYRVTSTVIMLTDPKDYEGGELHFPDLKLKFKLNKGDAIVFDSSLMHGVYPVTKGERYVLISFFFDDKGLEVKRRNFKNVDGRRYTPLLKNIKIDYPKLDNVKITGPEINVYEKGDIDYSDLHHKKEWTNDDDYFFEDNDSDTLLITFAGMGWKNSPPTFIFYNFLKSYTNVDKLFLRDLKMRYYIAGLKNSTNSYRETIKFYKNLIGKKKYKRVVGLGCSAGGFAAILYGLQLKFDKIIAFSPQTVINEKKDDLIGDKYNAPRTCQWLTGLNKEDEKYQKALDLINFKPFKTDIDIHYSLRGNNGIDKKHALYLNCDKRCKIIEHPGNDHMVALTLRNNGKLKKIIDESLQLEDAGAGEGEDAGAGEGEDAGSDEGEDAGAGEGEDEEVVAEAV